MRKVNTKIEDIMEFIKKLKGQNVDVEVNRGRKKTLKHSGVIESVYPSIFIVKSGEEQSSFSYSYADVLCGDVKVAYQNIEKSNKI